MYLAANYTFSHYKVAWMDISATVKAAAIVSGEGNEMPMPEHGVIFLTTESAEEAYYAAGVLNSKPVGSIISGYIVDNHLSTHPIENVMIPKFDAKNANHRLLARHSREAHQAATQGNSAALAQAEKAIEEAVKGLW